MRHRVRVVFEKEGSVPEELNKVKRFSHLLEYLALIWNVDIQVYAPHGNSLSAGNDNGVVRIYFFSYAKEFGSVRQSEFIDSLYGFPLPSAQDEKNDVGVKLSHPYASYPPGYDYQTVKSPEELVVAEIFPGNIYILFDIAHREWDGDEWVLWCILSEAFSWLFRREDRFLDICSRELSVTDHLHSRTAARASQFQERMADLCLMHIVKKLGEVSAEEEKGKNSYDALARENINLNFKIYDIEERIANPKRVLSDESLNREFDKILGMKTVKGIEIEQNSIVVYTKPLTMEESHNLIGEYRIIVTPYTVGSTAHTQVQIAEWGSRGPYAHAGISSNFQHLCWGPVVSDALVKAFADCDIPSAVHLALVFLIWDTRKPTLLSNPHNVQNAEDGQPVKPFYLDEDAKEKARRGYKEIVRRFKEKNLHHGLRERKAEFTRKQKDTEAELIKLRAQLKDLRETRGFLLERQKHISPESELASLLDDKRLIHLAIGSDWIWTVFAPQEGHGNFKGMIIPSFTLFFDVEHRRVFLSSWEGNNFPGKAKIGYRKEVLLDDDEKGALTRLIAFGHLGTAILDVRDLLFGKEEALTRHISKEITEA